VLAHAQLLQLVEVVVEVEDVAVGEAVAAAEVVEAAALREVAVEEEEEEEEGVEVEEAAAAAADVVAAAEGVRDLSFFLFSIPRSLLGIRYKEVCNRTDRTRTRNSIIFSTILVHFCGDALFGIKILHIVDLAQVDSAECKRGKKGERCCAMAI